MGNKISCKHFQCDTIEQYRQLKSEWVNNYANKNLEHYPWILKRINSDGKIEKAVYTYDRREECFKTIPIIYCPYCGRKF